MTFLELCQELRRESGASGQGPTAVTGQAGENLRIVNWVKEAWRRIQRSRESWRWMRSEASSFPLVVGTASYAQSSIVASRFGRWVKESLFLYNSTTGEKIFPEYMPYESFRSNFLYGATASNSAPQWWTIGPDEAIIFHPPPDATYAMRVSYYKSVQSLSADGDTPEMPSDFHAAIVYGGLMLYARYEAAQEILGEARMSYASEMQRLERSQLDQFESFTETLVE